MRKSQCLLLVLKRSYISHYIICMTVPLIKLINAERLTNEGSLLILLTTRVLNTGYYRVYEFYGVIT